MNLHHAMISAAVLAGGCTIGLEQDFEVRPGSAITDGTNDVLFQLENVGGNAPESFEYFRVEIDDAPTDGGLFARGDDGPVTLELVEDGGTVGVVDPGDVIRVVERPDGMNLSISDRGRSKHINVMLLGPNQRSSDALTRSWQTVWTSPWTVGE